MKYFALAAVLLAALVSHSLASIEKEPVRVTNRNSGPRYDIEEVDRSKLTPVTETSNANGNNNNNDNSPFERFGASRTPTDPQDKSQEPNEEAPFRHLLIRRIFLVPVGPPASMGGDESSAGSEPDSERVNPFLGQRRPSIWDGLLGRPDGSDYPREQPSRPAASSPPPSSLFDGILRPNYNNGALQPSSESGERESEPSRPFVDPIRMMVEMMHDAINSQTMSRPDLNREGSAPSFQSSEGSRRGSDEATSAERPAMKPQSKNETSEEVVEIDGKKYLRKTIINRHIGENIFFVTKRLVFVPLNETSDEPTTTTAAPVAEPTVLPKETSTATTTEVQPVEVVKTDSPVESTTTTTTSEAPIVSETSTSPQDAAPAATSEMPSMPSSTANPAQAPNTVATAETEDLAKARESWVERVTDAVEKAAERLTEKMKAQAEAALASSTTTTTTTEKPVEATTVQA